MLAAWKGTLEVRWPDSMIERDPRSSATRASPTGSRASSRLSGASSVLGHRRVYILPTRLGWFFGGTLAVLLIGSINYALALGFALTFLLAGMGLAGMVHTARNLARIGIGTGAPSRCSPASRRSFGCTSTAAGPSTGPRSSLATSALGSQFVVDIPAQRSPRWCSRPAAAPRLAAARPGDARDALSRWACSAPGATSSPTRAAWSIRARSAALAAAQRRGGCRRAAPRPAPATTTFRAARLPAHGLAAPRRLESRGAQRRHADQAVHREAAARAVARLGHCCPGLVGLEQRLSRLAGWVLAAERGAATACACPESRPAPRRLARRRLPGSAALYEPT